MEIIVGVIGLIIGAVVAWYLTGKAASSRAQNILSDAEKDAEVIRKNKLLEAKEEIISMKAEAEKQANARTSKIQITENRLKQREMSLNQRQEELRLIRFVLIWTTSKNCWTRKAPNWRKFIASQLSSWRQYRDFRPMKPGSV